MFILLTLSLAACDLGGGGSGGSSSSGGSEPNVEAAQVIDLPPGKTEATLGWAPSEGNVESYAVYESRNGGDYVLAETVPGTRVTLSGSDGDSVRISVFAVGRSGRASKPSPPSPILRFHAADPADQVAAAESAPPMRGSLSASVTSSSESARTVGTLDPAQDAAAAAGTDPSDSNALAAEEPTQWRADSILRRFVTSDARFPLAGFSESAQSWLQTRVEEHFNAGVRLVGTGASDQDGLRELVWQDPAGQLFLSTGRSILDATSPDQIPAGFVEGIRLRATERFVARGDFTNDAESEWVVEDVSTGEVLVIDAVTLDGTNARGAGDGIDWVLLGHGDFDADGRQEFLWQQPNGQLRFGHPSRALTNLQGTIPSPADSLMLSVADVDADGNDDIVSVDAAGRLEWTLVRASAPAAHFDWQAGPDTAVDALELMVTLDEDRDGRAEMAFFDGEILETWNALSGPL